MANLIAFLGAAGIGGAFRPVRFGRWRSSDLA
jgi:hypothetical protein